MKVSQIFHKLYMWMLMLPILIIPIFAINIMNKAVEPISVTTSGYEISNVYTETPFDNVNIILNNVYKLETGSFNLSNVNNEFIFKLIYCNEFTYNTIEEYIDETIVNNYNSNENNYINIDIQTDFAYVSFSNENGYTAVGLEEPTLSFDNAYIVFTDIYSSEDVLNFFESVDISILSDDGFNVKTYQYNEGIVLDNTDIGSQLIYSLYIPVHDYFNFGNFFGLNNMYNWFQLNFFNGTAPLSFYIFFNLMIYWLVISILWLLLDVLMYVPNLIHRWIDKAAL